MGQLSHAVQGPVLGYADDDVARLERIAANLARLGAEASGRINAKPVQAELFDITEAARRREESALWLLAKALGDCSM